jgi:hypothetical protein
MNLNDVTRIIGRRTTWGTGPSGVPRLRDVSTGLVVAACALLIAGCSTSATSGQSSRVQQQPPKGSATPSGSPTLAFQATGTCSHPERIPSPATNVPVSSLQRKLLERPQLPAGWCPQLSSDQWDPILKQWRDQAPLPSSNPMCAALDQRLGLAAANLGDTQASADYIQEYQFGISGGSSTYTGEGNSMYTGEVREILIQFPTAAEASAELRTYTSAMPACANWTDAANGSWITSSQQIHTHDLNTSADESIVSENSGSVKYQDGTSDTRKIAYAVLRKGPLLAYVTVDPAHHGMSPWPTAMLVLPAAANDLNR